jgi:hypothetical protein
MLFKVIYFLFLKTVLILLTFVKYQKNLNLLYDKFD